MPQFWIENVQLTAPATPDAGKDGFTVRSTPRPYDVRWAEHDDVRAMMADLLQQSAHALIVIDRIVLDLHFSADKAFGNVPLLVVDSSEEFKVLDGALKVVQFLDSEGATKTSTLFVIGGGIVQDVAGFAACIYKRGIPWTYVPTTFLAQSDSGMGSKAGLNYNGAKNVLAIFSAPRTVIMHSGFLETLGEEDLLSGLGECFRLCVTGGDVFLARFRERLEHFMHGRRTVLPEMLVTALMVKRAVIEYDEFELNVRRAMNYGHSLGHALEALTGNRIPHGTAVVLGMLIENEIAVSRGVQLAECANGLLGTAAKLVNAHCLQLLIEADFSSVVGLLAKDKKSEGKTIKLALLHAPGHIAFHSLELDDDARRVIEAGAESVATKLTAHISPSREAVY